MIENSFANLKKILLGDFFKNVTVLMTGTAIAQGLAFAASPILSRLYDPSAFGLLGLFTAACGILSVVASAKYELAILLPKNDEDAANILWLSLVIITLASLLTFVLILFFGSDIAELLGSPELTPLLWWAPLSILLVGLYNIFNYWSTRRKQFKRLSVSRVTQSVSREGTQLGMGWLNSFQGGGLVLGQVIGQAAATGSLIIQTYREDYNFIRKSYNKVRISELAKEHRDFPKYNAPQSFLNAFSQNVPAILLAFFFNPSVVGLYWFTHKVLLAPNQLIGNSVRQVFYQRANELVNEGKSVISLFIRTTQSLALIGIAPLLVVLVGGPLIFSFIFGSEWIEAGSYAQWIIIWWFVVFINPPSIMMIPILGIQKFQFYYELILIIIRVIAISVGGFLNNALLSIALFSVAGCISNSLLIIFVRMKLVKDII